jgi:hypothetical protein
MDGEVANDQRTALLKAQTALRTRQPSINDAGRQRDGGGRELPARENEKAGS